jgi:hypothetical protein
MADTSVKVSFIGDAKKLKNTIDDVERDIGGLGNKSKDFGSKFTAGFSKALPVLAGVGIAAGIMGSAVKDAMEDAAQQQTLATTLRNVAGATNEQVAAAEKWIDVTQRATGVADTDLRPALGLLTRQTGDVTKAQDLMRIAMDVAQGTGKDLNTVAAAMVKILEGNTGAASRLVPELTGIAREGAPASEVMDALAKTFAGQTAEHAGTMEGKFARLNIAFGEMKEKLGAALIGPLTDLTDWLIVTLPKIENAAKNVGEWWKEQDELHDALRDSARQAEEFGRALIPMGEAAWDAYLKVKPLVDAMVRLQQLTSVANVFGTGGKSVEDIARQKQIDAANTRGGFQLPGFAQGGVVGGRGPVGSPQLVVAHKGEEFLGVNGQRGSQTVVLNIDGRSFMTWLVDYSRDAGGIPITTRSSS